MQHQDSVSSVEWAIKHPLYKQSGTGGGECASLSDLLLLSSSFDFTVCLWSPDEDSKIWSVGLTLGAMTGNKHSYFGAKLLDYESEKPDKRYIMAYTYGGAVHLWN